MLKQKLLFIALSIVLLPLAGKNVSAEEFIITDNGSGSDNTITVTSTNTTTVEQNNTANIENNVEVEANTGDNTANANTGGETTIATGDIKVDTSIQNNVNNSQAVVENCGCESHGSAVISNNGAGSNNGVSYTNNNINTVNVNQTASVNNNINGYANTGGNNANYNNGNVAITTGNVTATEEIKNNTNHSKVKLLAGGHSSFLFKIDGNGAGSYNFLNLDLNNENVVNVENVSDIFNNSIWELITGNNSASKNNGDVVITTGDVKFSSMIENNVNSNEVEVDCGCKEENPEEPEEPENPTTPPATGGNGGNGGNGVGGTSKSDDKKGEVLAAAVGAILPATGTPWFMLAILGNLMMLLFGTLLRLRSGNSPGFAYAI